MVLPYFSLCLDIEFKETAGTEGPGTHGEGQTGKKFVMVFERGIYKCTISFCVFIDVPAEGRDVRKG